MRNVDEILDLMDDILDGAPIMPLTRNKSLIETEKMRELIGEIRLNMPNELKSAKSIVSDRKIIMKEARDEAEAIIKKAEERARMLVSNEEITKLAQAKANEIMTTAQAKAKELRFATNEYIDNMLNQLEELLSRDLTDVKRTRQSLKSSR